MTLKIQSLTICGRCIRLGDHLKVRYTSGERMLGATIEGDVVELWESPLQARLSCGWCFHDHDEIIEYKAVQP